MLITVKRTLNKDFRLSKNFNSVGGNTGYGIEVQIEVKDLDDKKIEQTFRKLDSIVEEKVNNDYQFQMGEASNLLK